MIIGFFANHWFSHKTITFLQEWFKPQPQSICYYLFRNECSIEWKVLGKLNLGKKKGNWIDFFNLYSPEWCTGCFYYLNDFILFGIIYSNWGIYFIYLKFKFVLALPRFFSIDFYLRDVTSLWLIVKSYETPSLVTPVPILQIMSDRIIRLFSKWFF